MKRILLSAALASATLTAATFSIQPAFASNNLLQPSNTTLILGAQGKSTKAPDYAIFTAGVASTGRTAGAAMATNNADMNRVFEALKSAGVAPRDIQTNQITLSPVYAQPNPAVRNNNDADRVPRIVGYNATNKITVRQRNLKEYGRIIDTLITAGANQVNGPHFQLDNPEAALDEARTQAVKNARQRADLLAAAAGLRVVRIISINESSGYGSPEPMYRVAAEMADGAPAPAPLAVGEVDMSSSVGVQFELAPIGR